jgi:hypothetical protein
MVMVISSRWMLVVAVDPGAHPVQGVDPVLLADLTLCSMRRPVIRSALMRRRDRCDRAPTVAVGPGQRDQLVDIAEREAWPLVIFVHEVVLELLLRWPRGLVGGAHRGDYGLGVNVDQ